MPIYEYHCGQCNKDFECLVFGKETPFCPSCESLDVSRFLSACSFISKGGNGETVRAASSGCSTCAAGSCASCGH